MEQLSRSRALTNRGAAECGISRSVLGSNFTPVLHGVHIHKSVEPSLAVRCAAAGLVLPTGAVFSDLTALELLGLPLLFGTPRDRPLDVTVVPPLDRPQGSGIRGHRRGLRGRRGHGY